MINPNSDQKTTDNRGRSFTRRGERNGCKLGLRAFSKDAARCAARRAESANQANNVEIQ